MTTTGKTIKNNLLIPPKKDFCSSNINLIIIGTIVNSNAHSRDLMRDLKAKCGAFDGTGESVLSVDRSMRREPYCSIKAYNKVYVALTLKISVNHRLIMEKVRYGW